MKKLKQCVICREPFKTKTTSIRLTCSTKCSVEYRNTPEYKARLKARRNTPEYKARLKARQALKNHIDEVHRI